MARSSYSFEKRKREADKRKKKAEKAEQKKNRRERKGSDEVDQGIELDADGNPILPADDDVEAADAPGTAEASSEPAADGATPDAAAPKTDA